MRSSVGRARLVARALFFPSLAPGAPSPRAPGVAPGVVVPPREVAAPRAVVVYLHGMCGAPDDGCSYLRGAVSERAWLLCPRAPAGCGAAASWSSPASTRAAVERLVAAAERAAPDAIDRAAPGVLVGFSQGAYAAEQLLRMQPGRWRAVAFVTAHIRWSRARLERTGVRRAAFAATRGDLTRPVLIETARRLRAEGFPARFVDLGRGGHSYAAARGAASWRDVMAWLDGA